MSGPDTASDAGTQPEQASRIERRIGQADEVRIRVGRGQVSLRGVDGDTVTAVDLDGQGGVRVRQGPGWLEIRAADKGPAERAGADKGASDWGSSWGDLLAASLDLRSGRSRHTANIEVQLPRGAQVDVEATSADIRSDGLAGTQRYKTVSGDVQVVGAHGGPISSSSVSGDISIAGVARLAIRATTVSGQVDLSAPELEAIEIQTTSGDTRLSGRLRPGEHRISSVSGDAIVVTDGGLAAQARTISGDVATDLPHRREGGRGSGRVVIGDGAARLSFKSMSGDLAVMAPARPSGGSAATPATPATPAQTPTSAAGPDPRLAVLQALERGEIDVDEAGRRLADIDSARTQP